MQARPKKKTNGARTKIKLVQPTSTEIGTVVDRIASATADLYLLATRADCADEVRDAVLVLDATVRTLDQIGNPEAKAAYGKIATQARQFLEGDGVRVVAGDLGTAVLDEAQERRIVFDGVVRKIEFLQMRVRGELSNEKAEQLLSEFLVQVLWASKISRRFASQFQSPVHAATGVRTQAFAERAAQLRVFVGLTFRSPSPDAETEEAMLRDRRELALALLRGALKIFGVADVDGAMRGLEQNVRRARPNKK